MNVAPPSTLRGCPLASTDPAKPFRPSLPLSSACLPARFVEPHPERDLQHQSDMHLQSFQVHEHFLAEKGGWHQERFSNSSTNSSPSRKSCSTLRHRAVLRDESAPRQSASASPLESALTESPPTSPLESALTKKGGVGDVMLTKILPARPPSPSAPVSTVTATLSVRRAIISPPRRPPIPLPFRRLT